MIPTEKDAAKALKLAYERLLGIESDRAEITRQYHAALAATNDTYREVTEAHEQAMAVFALARLPTDKRDLLLPEEPESGALVARKLATHHCSRGQVWTDLGKRVRALWLAEKGAP